MKRKGLPKEVVDHWPEIFSDVDVKAIPLEYTHSMRIIFKNGNEWDIDIDSYAKKDGLENIEVHLQELLSNYEESIDRIDFKLDIEKVKKDVIKTTRSFLKKPNKKK